MLHPSATSELWSLGRLARKSETDPGLGPTDGDVAPVRGGILRCGYDDERSGTNDDADGCGGGAGNCGAGGCRVFVGFLVSGGAKHGDSRAEPPRGKFLRCEIRARTGGYRCRTGGSMEKWWSAATTDGGLMRVAGSASRFHRCPART